MSTKDELEKSYERAIKAREHHYKNFNYWMNFYALIIGALFVGYYTINDDCMLKMIVTLIGFSASFAWLQSFRGYYHWIIQWINVVQFHEEKYLESVNENNKENVIEIDNLRTYTLYYESDDEESKCPLKSRNISTQKMTLRFIFLLTITWGFLLIYHFVNMLFLNFCTAYLKGCKCGCIVISNSCLILATIFCIGIILLFMLFCKDTGSHIKRHCRLKGDIGKYTVVSPDFTNNISLKNNRMKNKNFILFAWIIISVFSFKSISAQSVSIWDGTSEIWTQGQGTESSPYLIENAQQLAYLAEVVNGGVTHYDDTYFKLSTNVYIDSTTSWEPIGLNETYYFGGHFDGNNHLVTLYLNTSSLQYVGIFGYAKNGSISNLGSAGRILQTITPNAYAGGICGYTTTTISNCHNAGNISSISSSGNSNSISCTGGICGYVYSGGNNIIINNCHNSGAITSNAKYYSYAGGICGYSATLKNYNGSFNCYISLVNCYNSGDIFSSSTYSISSAGGILGYSYVYANSYLYSNGSSSNIHISNCHSTGSVMSSAYDYSLAGGICGYVYVLYDNSNGPSDYNIYVSSNIENCNNTGNTSAVSTYAYSPDAYSGGICGFAKVESKTNNGFVRRNIDIRNCYNTGSISSSCSSSPTSSAVALEVGGICGRTIGYYKGSNGNIYSTAGASINNSYNVGSLLNGDSKGGISGYGGSITNCHYLNTCGHNTTTDGTAKTEAQMKSSSFPVILNTDSVVFVIDGTPNINQGYPIFGSVTTFDAENLGNTVATLKGNYQMLYNVDTHGFEYKKNSESNYTTINTSGEGPVSYNVSGLDGGTAYTYRFFVQKDGVTYRGLDKTFNTVQCSLDGNVVSSSASLCDGDTVTYSITPTSTNATSYQYEWSTGEHTNNISVTNDATYTVTVTDNFGCSIVRSKQMTLYPAAVASITGSTVICGNNGTTLTANGGTYYSWNTGSAQRTITVNQPGTYIATVQTVYGCTANDTVEVVAFANPVIYGNTVFCSGGYTTLSATGGETYQWSTGATTASINVNAAGTYSVTASTSNGCSGNASVTVIQNQASDVAITGNTVICSGIETSLTASSGTDYLWSTGETTQSISVNNPGTYSVTVTNSNGCSNSATQTVSLMEQPIISGNNHICSGQSTTLSVSGSGSYAWSNGANTSFITVNTPGTYTVTVTLPNGCSSSATMDVSVGTTPTPSILGNTTICQGQTTTLTANGGNSYTWSNGNTTNSINVNQSGVYSVTATNAEGCSATTNVTVTVNPLPNVSISGNNSFCQDDNTTLTAMGASTYAWSNSSTDNAITVNNAGTYTVTGTDANGCTNTATHTVSVNPTYNIPLTHSICEGESYNFYGQNITTAGTYTHTLQTVNGCDSVLTLVVTLKALPTITISGNTTLCEGESTILTANNGISYNWSNGSATNSINVAESGVYTVTATNAEGCSATATATVTVNPLPIVNISGNSSFCQGDNITLTATGASTYAWSNNSTDNAITVNNAGTYTVTGTDANGCSNTATHTVSVNPTYNIPLTHSICEGESYNFHGQNITTAGTYTHTLQTVNGCDSVLTLVVTLKALPTIAISGYTTLCEGESTTLTANGGISYNWSNGSTTNSINVAESGVYMVTATNVEGCSAVESVTVTVNPLPNITIGGNTSICEGGSTTLTASGADTYSWSTGDNTASATISAFGIYTVTGTSAAGCSSVASVTVLVSQLPVITITGETDICAGESTTLTANGGTTYLWSNGTTDAALTVSNAGTYQVIGYNEAGCNTIASTTVNVWQPATSEFSVECPDSCYTWNDVDYCQSGDYTQTLQTVHGCDSVVTLHLTITVGIDNYNSFDFKVYPNPSNGVVNVQCTMNNVQFSDVVIHVVDMYGKLVRTKPFDGETTHIDISDLATGIYFVKAVADGKVVAVRKVVKQ